MSTLTLTFGDESKENSSVAFHTPTVTALNYEAYIGDAATGATDELIAAVSAFSRSSYLGATLTDSRETGEDYPVDPDAQNELKAQFRYRDSANNRVYRFEIPGYNMVAKVPGQDDIDLTSQEVQDLITALSLFKGPGGGDITVISGKLVGRNI